MTTAKSSRVIPGVVLFLLALSAGVGATEAPLEVPADFVELGPSHDTEARDLAWPGAATLVAGVVLRVPDVDGMRTAEIRSWDVARRSVTRTLAGVTSRPSEPSFAFSPDGKLAAVGAHRF